MALVVKDRVQETSTTTGTGTITLAGAVSGFQSFSAIGNANTTYYAIVGGTQWEVGLGTYTSSGTTLSRDTVLASSNGGSAVNFSAGTKNVFVTYPADKSIYDDAAGNVIGLGTPASVTLTNGTGLPISTGVSGLGTGVATFLATPSSANLASAVTDETGSGSLVFATSPTVASPTFTSQSTFAAGTAASPALTTTGDTNTGIFFPAADTIAFTEGGAEAMRINSSGNVGIGTSSPTSSLTVVGTGITNANWTTATRPSSPNAGQQGWNTTLGQLDVYSGSAWISTYQQPYTASYLIVAGGGGAGYFRGGGGGAGGLLTGTTTLNLGVVYSVVVGSGGSGTAGAATNGGDSSITGLTTAVGGGRGGNLFNTAPAAASGGSGGGGGGTNSGGPHAGGSGTSGQGNAGGTGYTGGEPFNGGGGGGAGAVGGSNVAGANGGVGSITTIITTTIATTNAVGQVSSSNVYFSGGGGSGGFAASSAAVGSGGLGGGGAGTNVTNTNGTSGTANTGGGGGGGPNSSTSNGNGGNGGSGCVILSVPTVNYTGVTTGSPTVTTSGSNTIIIFKSSGSYGA